MTDHILSIDPGVSTGATLISYDAETVPKMVSSWQFRGGAEALNEWVSENFLGLADGDDGVAFRLPSGSIASTAHHLDLIGSWAPNLTIIVEKFNARNTRGFSYTTDSLEPLRCEGVLIGRGIPHEYVQPPQQYIAGGTEKADKKKRQHRLLKDTGYYRTGKDLESPDADDFRSSAAHALGYLARNGHRPTHDMISDWVERN